MKTTKNIFAEYGRTILSVTFLAVILTGPVCAAVGVLIPSVGTKLTGLIAAALHLM